MHICIFLPHSNKAPEQRKEYREIDELQEKERVPKFFFGRGEKMSIGRMSHICVCRNLNSMDLSVEVDSLLHCKTKNRSFFVAEVCLAFC
ncbi:hypothetical protein CEXT_291631 [Caerostris extrusa]|uniref:Uncharacterized protein n=1 Tax=Caerostris extrusa TaxID=172846 RepID=A0AAV4W7P0_CAEEX|nr:hypothetical protein CEXT_291631 [Caerostris extrusa]